MERVIEVGKIYKHFKGNLYKVLHIAYDSEASNETKKLVVYEALYDDHKVWVRDYDMFNSLVDSIKYPNITQRHRFEEYNGEN